MKPLYVMEPGPGRALVGGVCVRAACAPGVRAARHGALDPSAGGQRCVWNGFVVGPGTAVKGVSLLLAG